MLGRVAGTMVASRKEPTMEGLKFLVVRHLDVDNNDLASFVVAVDAVGRGRRRGGARGHRELRPPDGGDRDRPCDAVVMAIVDTWEVGGEERFRK